MTYQDPKTRLFYLMKNETKEAYEAPAIMRSFPVDDGGEAATIACDKEFGPEAYNSTVLLCGLSEGQRVRATCDVERFPHFVVPKGSLGRLVWEGEYFTVKVDEPIDGMLEEWDNEVYYNEGNGDDFVLSEWECIEDGSDEPTCSSCGEVADFGQRGDGDAIQVSALDGVEISEHPMFQEEFGSIIFCSVECCHKEGIHPFVERLLTTTERLNLAVHDPKAMLETLESLIDGEEDGLAEMLQPVADYLKTQLPLEEEPKTEDRESVIERASQAALDEGCVIIQDALGETDGGFASCHFSGDNEDEVRDVFSRYFDAQKRWMDAHEGEPMETQDRAKAIGAAEQSVLDQMIALAAKCALADLIGIMPEFEPSGEREHPAWQTIKDLCAALGETLPVSLFGEQFKVGDRVRVTEEISPDLSDHGIPEGAEGEILRKCNAGEYEDPDRQGDEYWVTLFWQGRRGYITQIVDPAHLTLINKETN